MNYTLIIEKGKDGIFVGSVVELPGCYTQAHSIDALVHNIREAIQLYLETEKEEGNLTEFVGIQKVSL